MKQRVNRLDLDNINLALDVNERALRDELRNAFAGASTVREGRSPVLLNNAHGSIAFDGTSVGNEAGVETTLRTVTLPARALGTDGDGVHLKVGGTFAAGSSVDIRVYFGGGTVFTGTGVSSIGLNRWLIESWCWRISATAVKCLTRFSDDETAFVAALAGHHYEIITGLALSDAQVFSVTGYELAADKVIAEVSTFTWTSAP